MISKYHKDVINIVANRLRVDPNLVESIVEFNYKKTSQMMKSRDAPDILLHGIGRFSANIGKIKNKLFAYYITILKQRDTEVIKETTLKTLESYTNLYERKCKECKIDPGPILEQVREDIINIKKLLNEEESKEHITK